MAIAVDDMDRPLDKKLCVFLSYTSREDEVELVQPLVDAYCQTLWQKARNEGVYVFYDHFSLEREWYPDDELEHQLLQHLSGADLFVGFISPSYTESQWCCFEWKHGPMSRSLGPHSNGIPAQAVYWKRDYHTPKPFDPEIVADLDSRHITDVTLVDRCPHGLLDPAAVAVEEGLKLVLRQARQRWSVSR